MSCKQFLLIDNSQFFYKPKKKKQKIIHKGLEFRKKHLQKEWV